MSIKTASELLAAKLAEHCETLRDALAYIEPFTKTEPLALFNPDHPSLVALKDMRTAQGFYSRGMASVVAEGADALVA
jgi:hypothetical protein